MKFTQVCFQDCDDANVWEAELYRPIEKDCDVIRLNHDDKGNVWIDTLSSGTPLVTTNLKRQGENETRLAAISFAQGFFYSIMRVCEKA